MNPPVTTHPAASPAAPRARAITTLVGLVLLLLAVLAADQARPAAAAPSPEVGSSDWLGVSAGFGHTCGIRTGGRLHCWGWDAAGQLGDGGANTSRPTPARIGTATDWRTVSAGGLHTCGLRTSGRLFCWGDDTYGQLGDNPTLALRSRPTQVAGNRTDWVAVDVGANHTCARRRDGRLFCWGQDAAGKLGNGAPMVDRPVPTAVAGNRTDWTSFSAGSNSTCARRRSGRLFCWGSDYRGQLGNGAAATGDRTAPSPVGGRTDWTSVTVGDSHACARRTDSSLWCWGLDAFGAVGDGGVAMDRSAPVRVSGPLTGWRSVSAGFHHTCAVRVNGRLFCWGSDAKGQLGDSVAVSSTLAPVQVAGARTDWATVSGGNEHTCARDTAGRLSCWGADTYGQLGDDALLAGKATPVPVAS